MMRKIEPEKPFAVRLLSEKLIRAARERGYVWEYADDAQTLVYFRSDEFG